MARKSIDFSAKDRAAETNDLIYEGIATYSSRHNNAIGA